MQHLNTHLYQRSLELIDVTKAVLDQLPTGYGFLADQLRKASSSVVLNFSEGGGRRTAKERRRFFEIARASSHEVAAIFDVAMGFGVIDAGTHETGKELCDRVSAMLYRFR